MPTWFADEFASVPAGLAMSFFACGSRGPPKIATEIVYICPCNRCVSDIVVSMVSCSYFIAASLLADRIL